MPTAPVDITLQHGEARYPSCVFVGLGRRCGRCTGIRYLRALRQRADGAIRRAFLPHSLHAAYNGLLSGVRHHAGYVTHPARDRTRRAAPPYRPDCGMLDEAGVARMTRRMSTTYLDGIAPIRRDTARPKRQIGTASANDAPFLLTASELQERKKQRRGRPSSNRERPGTDAM
jgi:hypothetical protein